MNVMTNLPATLTSDTGFIGAVSFAWPSAFAALALVPLLVVGYVQLLKRQRRRTEELASQGFVPTAAAVRLRKRRHIPAVFFLGALTVLLTSFSRPQASVTVPKREGTVILAFDASNSMLATDVKPSRMDAAKEAARAFVEKQPPTIKIGVVAFGNGGVVTRQPTNDKASVLTAIKQLKPRGATSLGQGIFAALNAIAGKPIKVDPAILTSGLTDSTQVDIGHYSNAAIILLSDGENNGEVKPEDVAKLASIAGVKIHTVGIGSPEGTEVEIDGFRLATSLNEDMLNQIAKVTDGSYFKAADAPTLSKVYQSIDLKWKSDTKNRELTPIFAAVAAALLGIGSMLTLRWFGRLV